MRRMITETDVEKLDSIQPSEMQKLAAMQDPKTAKANQVLTADGTGKAVYKDASGRQQQLFLTSIKNIDISLFFGAPDFPLPENEFGYNQLAAYFYYNNIISFSLLTMTGSNGIVIHGNLSANDGIVIDYNNDKVTIYISEDIQQQLNISGGTTVECKATYTTISLI